VAVNVPVPVPDGVTVHHVWLLTAVQDVLEVIAKLVVPAGLEGTFWLEGKTVKVLNLKIKGLAMVPKSPVFWKGIVSMTFTISFVDDRNILNVSVSPD